MFISIAVTLFMFPHTVSAVGNLKDAGKQLFSVGNRAGTSDVRNIEDITGKVINGALTLVGIIFLLLMVYAGYLWMTARGEEEPINKAKKIVQTSIIGLVLVMSAYAITVFVTKQFEGGGTRCTEVNPGYQCVVTCTSASQASAPGLCDQGQICCGP